MTLAELTIKLASLDKSRAALESSYESIEFWLFLFTALVVIGLVVEYREGLKKLFSEWPIDWSHAATMIGAILVVVGVVGELVTEFWASKIESGLQTVSTQTERLLFAEAADADKKIADDNKIAMNAAKHAADLGVRVDELPSFVAQKRKEINDEINDFQKSAVDQKRQTDALIAGLNSDRQKLDRSRIEAVEAANQAKDALAAVTAARKPRDLTIEQRKVIAEQMSRWTRLPNSDARQSVAVFTTNSLFESAHLADQIASALGVGAGAGWSVNRNSAQFGMLVSGVGLYTSSNTRGQAVAAALAATLNAEGIVAFVIEQKSKGCEEYNLTEHPDTEPYCSHVSVMVGDHP